MKKSENKLTNMSEIDFIQYLMEKNVIKMDKICRNCMSPQKPKSAGITVKTFCGSVEKTHALEGIYDKRKR